MVGPTWETQLARSHCRQKSRHSFLFFLHLLTPVISGVILSVPPSLRVVASQFLSELSLVFWLPALFP